MPYTKIAVVVMGCAFGFLFDARQRIGPEISKTLANRGVAGHSVAWANWVLALVILASGIWMEFTINHDADTWTETESLAFITFYRPVFCLACAMSVLPVFFGYGNTLRNFLGSFPMRVLGRLSYGAYLSFPLAQCLFYSMLPDSMVLYMGKTPVIYLTNIVVCFIFSFFTFLLLEEPCRKFNSLLFGQLGWANKEPVKIRKILFTQNNHDLMAKAAY